MKIFGFVLTGLIVTAFVTGCQPELAQVQYGQEEAQWEQYVDRNYSGFKPPRTAPPAIVDKVSPKLIEEEQNRPAPQLPAPQPEVITQEIAVESLVDSAADGKVATTETAVTTVTEESVATPQPAANTVPATAAPATGSITYLVKPGDTLSYIAQKFYKDGSKFDLILKANQNVLKNPNALRPGMKLEIPQL